MKKASDEGWSLRMSAWAVTAGGTFLVDFDWKDPCFSDPEISYVFWSSATALQMGRAGTLSSAPLFKISL